MLALVTLLLAAAPPEIALLCTDGAGHTGLHRATPGAPAASAALAALSHHPEGAVQGALLPGKGGAVVAVRELPGRDPSFADALYRLEPGKNPALLARGVAHGNAPLVSERGRLFVQRGVAGPESSDGQLRVDRLTIDEVNPKTGALRTVYATFGYTAFLAGHFEGELLVYRVGPEGSSLLAVQQDALAVRTLLASAPLARDFAVDARGAALLFTRGDPATGRFHVERLALRTLALRTLEQGGEDPALLPALLADGRVVVSAGPGRGLKLAGSDGPAIPSQGPAYDRLRAAAGEFLVGTQEGAHLTPWLLERGAAVPLASPSSDCIPLGFWP